MAFRREMRVPRGGPSGGDGGNGGSIYLVASPHQNTLVTYRFHPEFKAAARPARHGVELHRAAPARTWSSKCRRARWSTKSDRDGLIPLADLTEVGAARARRARRPRRPRKRGVCDGRPIARRAGPNPGSPARNATLRLRLKLLADVGLVGFPERRQEHADRAHLGGAPEDRRLPVHDAHAQSRRRAAERRPLVRRRRRARPDRRRAPRPRARHEVPRAPRAHEGARAHRRRLVGVRAATRWRTSRSSAASWNGFAGRRRAARGARGQAADCRRPTRSTRSTIPTGCKRLQAHCGRRSDRALPDLGRHRARACPRCSKRCGIARGSADGAEPADMTTWALRRDVRSDSSGPPRRGARRPSTPSDSTRSGSCRPACRRIGARRTPRPRTGSPWPHSAVAAETAVLRVGPRDGPATGPSYTVDTLDRLSARPTRPRAPLFFITGADAFRDIANWRAYPGGARPLPLRRGLAARRCAADASAAAAARPAPTACVDDAVSRFRHARASCSWTRRRAPSRRPTCVGALSDGRAARRASCRPPWPTTFSVSVCTLDATETPHA